MRTRTRDMVRMLATLRHSAQCRTLRAAKAHEALLRASEEAREAQDDSAAFNDDDDATAPSATAPSHRRH
jgi:hypothetical protein